MIKLKLPDKPSELTEDKERELVEEYKFSEKAVWKQDFIVQPLLEMSHYKCAYSEQKLNSESAYMQVEHFMHKGKYPDLVVKWGNLLPSCQKCNVSKGVWDVVDQPIVNPLVDTPSDHLYIKAFRFYKKDDKGSNTIAAVALNDREHFVQPRADIGFRIADMIETLYDTLQNANTVRKRKNVVNQVKNVLYECGPNNVYSAVLSTYILYELETYSLLKNSMKNLDLWDEELESLEYTLLSLAMPEPNKHKR